MKCIFLCYEHECFSTLNVCARILRTHDITYTRTHARICAKWVVTIWWLHAILSLTAIYLNASQFNPLVLSYACKTNKRTVELSLFKLIQVYSKWRWKKVEFIEFVFFFCGKYDMKRVVLHSHFATATIRETEEDYRLHKKQKEFVWMPQACVSQKKLKRFLEVIQSTWRTSNKVKCMW